MNLKLRTITTSLFLASFLLLLACGNTPTKGQDMRLARSYGAAILARMNDKEAAKAASLASRDFSAANEAILKVLPGPVISVFLKEIGGFAALLEFGKNQGHVTWTTSTRQSLTFRRGVLTATRGLVDDLMSAKVEGSAALVTSKRDGATKRVHRYLDGEGVTASISLECTVERGAVETYAVGEIRATTRIMTESCAGDDYAFQNTYWVDSSGMILQSRQWISPTLNYARFQRLRR